MELIVSQEQRKCGIVSRASTSLRNMFEESTIAPTKNYLIFAKEDRLKRFF